MLESVTEAAGNTSFSYFFRFNFQRNLTFRIKLSSGKKPQIKYYFNPKFTKKKGDTESSVYGDAVVKTLYITFTHLAGVFTGNQTQDSLLYYTTPSTQTNRSKLK